MTLRRVTPLVSLLALLPVSSHAKTLELTAQLKASLERTPEELRIIGGKKVESCHWPAAVLLPIGEGNKVSSICTGSLVHPEIVLTAAHCNDGILGAAFTEDLKSLSEEGSRLHKIEYCTSHPGWEGASSLSENVDLAFCKLAKPVNDVPPTPVLMGCEADWVMDSGPSTVMAVGYGKNVASEEAAGVKYEAEITFNGISSTGEILVGEPGKGICHGDSGGPAYVKLPEDKFGKDAGWRVIGVTSYGAVTKEKKECIGTGAYCTMHTFVEFVEKESGIDITPCTDAKGEWKPGKDCKGAPLDPYAASGSWPNSCEHAPGGGWIASCGEPFTPDEEGEDGGGDVDGDKSKEKDTNAPKVSISSPEDGDQFSQGKSIKVKVDAKDDVEVAKVILLVDDKEQKADKKKPYSWKLKDLEPGEHELVAKAVDAAGNEAESETVTIRVKKSKKGDSKGEETQGEEGTGTDSEGGETKGDDTGSSTEDGKKKKDETDSAKGSDAPESTEVVPLKKSGCSVEESSTPFGWSLVGLGLWALGRRRRRA